MIYKRKNAEIKIRNKTKICCVTNSSFPANKSPCFPSNMIDMAIS
jgi:hypothetical protein